MSEATTTTNSNKLIDRLTEKRKELENELKETNRLLRSKKAAQKAKQTAKDKKNRTKSLILLGLFFTRLLKDMRKEEQNGFTQAAELYHQKDLKTLENFTDNKKTPEKLADLKTKRKDNLESNHILLKTIIQSAIEGTFK